MAITNVEREFLWAIEDGDFDRANSLRNHNDILEKSVDSSGRPRLVYP